MCLIRTVYLEMGGSLMSLISILGGYERDSQYLKRLIRPFKPWREDFLAISPFGWDLKVPSLCSRGEAGLIGRAFSEIFRLVLARRSGFGASLLRRLEGARGLETLAVVSPSLRQTIHGDFLAARVHYRKYLAQEATLGECLDSVCLMAKLSLISSSGFCDMDARELVRGFSSRTRFELALMADLWERFLEQRYLSGVPAPLFSPCFGPLSEGMGGASADILHDGYLIDTVCVQNLQNLSRYMDRVATLLVLGQAFKTLDGTGYQEKGVGLYLARYGVLLLLDRGSFIRLKRAEFARAEIGVLRRFGRIDKAGVVV